ncbi:hypothetical protein KUA24_153 [Vibrio phage HNL01]|nr:hypothetical protein KUA24_153 [Vibrio phage HNL01]
MKGIIYKGVHEDIQLTSYEDWIILEDKLKELMEEIEDEC